MPIEFRCHSCQKLLRTPDDRAGAEAICPQCGAAIVVPQPDPPAAPSSPDVADPWLDSDAPVSPTDEPDLRPCPMCGELIRARAKRCRACGETLSGPGAGSVEPSLVAGDVISRAWRIFQDQMGACIGATVLMMGISYGLYIAFSVGMQLMFFGVMAAGARDPEKFLVLFAVLAIIAPVVLMAVFSFLLSGWSSYMLKIAKGDKPEIGEIFRGGQWWLRMLAASLLSLILLTVIGLVVCGIPIAAIVAMRPEEPMAFLGIMGLTLAGYLLAVLLTGMFVWPFPFFLVDQDARGVDCLGRAFSSLSGRRYQSLLLTLASLGLLTGGWMLCCFGLIFTAPLAGVILTVAYCDLTGQPTA